MRANTEEEEKNGGGIGGFLLCFCWALEIHVYIILELIC